MTQTAVVTHMSQAMAVGYKARIVISSDWVVVETPLPWRQGTNLFDISGVEEVFGADYRRCMANRETVVIRRLFGGSIWQNLVAPTDDGGLSIDTECLYRITACDLMSVSRFCACANRVSAILADGVGPAKRPSEPPPLPPRAGSLPLHAVPSIP